MGERTCESCGSDRYHARAFPRVRDEARYWQRQARRLAAEVAQLKLDAELRDFRDRTDVAWLQGKVVAQRRELRRLNDARNAEAIRDHDVDPLPDVEVRSITDVEVDAARLRETERTREARGKDDEVRGSG